MTLKLESKSCVIITATKDGTIKLAVDIANQTTYAYKRTWQVDELPTVKDKDGKEIKKARRELTDQEKSTCIQEINLDASFTDVPLEDVYALATEQLLLDSSVILKPVFRGKSAFPVWFKEHEDKETGHYVLDVAEFLDYVKNRSRELTPEQKRERDIKCFSEQSGLPLETCRLIVAHPELVASLMSSKK
jgi:hypothetical protein